MRVAGKPDTRRIAPVYTEWAPVPSHPARVADSTQHACVSWQSRVCWRAVEVCSSGRSMRLCRRCGCNDPDAHRLDPAGERTELAGPVSHVGSGEVPVSTRVLSRTIICVAGTSSSPKQSTVCDACLVYGRAGPTRST